MPGTSASAARRKSISKLANSRQSLGGVEKPSKVSKAATVKKAARNVDASAIDEASDSRTAIGIGEAVKRRAELKAKEAAAAAAAPKPVKKKKPTALIIQSAPIVERPRRSATPKKEEVPVQEKKTPKKTPKKTTRNAKLDLSALSSDEEDETQAQHQESEEESEVEEPEVVVVKKAKTPASRKRSRSSSVAFVDQPKQEEAELEVEPAVTLPSSPFFKLESVAECKKEESVEMDDIQTPSKIARVSEEAVSPSSSSSAMKPLSPLAAEPSSATKQESEQEAIDELSNIHLLSPPAAMKQTKSATPAAVSAASLKQMDLEIEVEEEQAVVVEVPTVMTEPAAPAEYPLLAAAKIDVRKQNTGGWTCSLM